jgi:serine/threonine protein kinase
MLSSLPQSSPKEQRFTNPPGTTFVFYPSTQTCQFHQNPSYPKRDEVSIKYNQGKTLGSGTYGVVNLMTPSYSYQHPVTTAITVPDIAVKKYHCPFVFPWHTPDEQLKQIMLSELDGFSREAQYNYQLNGVGAVFYIEAPIVIAINESGNKYVKNHPQAYIAMKYIKGKMLSNYAITSAQTYCRVMLASLAALKKVHTQFIHGDIHQGNVIINEENDKLTVEFIDFTLSRRPGEKIEKLDVLNLDIKPPEFKNKSSITAHESQDIWCMGLMFCQYAKSLSFSDNLRPIISNILKGMMAEIPQKRMSLEEAEKTLLIASLQFRVLNFSFALLQDLHSEFFSANHLKKLYKIVPASETTQLMILFFTHQKQLLQGGLAREQESESKRKILFDQILYCERFLHQLGNSNDSNIAFLAAKGFIERMGNHSSWELGIGVERFKEYYIQYKAQNLIQALKCGFSDYQVYLLSSLGKPYLLKLINNKSDFLAVFDLIPEKDRKELWLQLGVDYIASLNVAIDLQPYLSLSDNLKLVKAMKSNKKEFLLRLFNTKKQQLWVEFQLVNDSPAYLYALDKALYCERWIHEISNNCMGVIERAYSGIESLLYATWQLGHGLRRFKEFCLEDSLETFIKLLNEYPEKIQLALFKYLGKDYITENLIKNIQQSIAVLNAVHEMVKTDVILFMGWTYLNSSTLTTTNLQHHSLFKPTASSPLKDALSISSQVLNISPK